MQSDILVLGATGFTGRLVATYLAKHRERSRFSLAFGGRSRQRLLTLVSDLSLPDTIPLFVVDITNVGELMLVVRKFKVVINAIGPYWALGMPIVEACVLAGTNYLDFAGETPWLMDVISKFGPCSPEDSVIVPACGFESVPSDVSVFVSVCHLQKMYGPEVRVGNSTTAHRLKAFVSGGTLASGIGLLDDIPRHQFWTSTQPYSLSPVQGRSPPPAKLVYKLPGTKVWGSFFSLSFSNRANVNRTWGLFQTSAIHHKSISPYGPDFVYEEFLAVSSPWAAMIISIITAVLGCMLLYIAPIRWALRWASGFEFINPSYDALKTGSLEAMNVTSTVPSSKNQSVYTVHSTVKTIGDSGYIGGSVAISECALAILFTPRHLLPLHSHTSRVLTPVAACGSVLVDRLKASGFFEIESRIVIGGEERRK